MIFQYFRINQGHKMDIFAGVCAGITEAIVGYPLVVCKVLAQSGKRWHGHSLSRYYRGVQYPLINSIGFNSIVFPVHNRFYNETGSHATAGFFSGFFVAPTCFLLDTLAISAQLNQPVKFRPAGFSMTLVRETAAMSIYFSTYFHTKDYLGIFGAGALAGATCWSITFPIDTVRTRFIGGQADAFRLPLWHGVRFALARAAIVNAAVFSVYESIATE